MMDLHKKAIPLRRGSLFDCRSSTKTAHETSTMCAVEWLQSTVNLEFDVVPPPRPPERRARRVKARCCGLRHVCNLMCVLRQDFPRGEPKVKRLEEIYGVLVLGWVSSAKTAHETSTMCAVE